MPIRIRRRDRNAQLARRAGEAAAGHRSPTIVRACYATPNPSPGRYADPSKHCWAAVERLIPGKEYKHGEDRLESFLQRGSQVAR